jgi:hypothetical protein
MMTIAQELRSLYETDSDRWLEITIQLLKEKRLEELDLENLIEELESLSRRDKLAIESLLEQIIRHILLLQYWQEQSTYNRNHWQAEVMSFRSQLHAYLTTNLRKHLRENYVEIYRQALRYVRKKTGNTVEFPEDCPYLLEQLIDRDWLP